MTRRHFENRGLTPEEEALWRKAMRDVAAYGRKKPLAEKLVSGSQSGSQAVSKSAPGLLKPRHITGQSAGPTPSRHAEPLPSRTQHPFAAGDPRLDKLAGRGRLPIDAVLDLHGHTQRTAETTLRRFVMEAHSRGARCVLVITGKGAPDLSGSGARGWEAPGGKGVLKARLSDWLADEPLRKLVSRASPAHQRHGGGGAFYLFLKR
ncbi:Smr/MutS family protein [Hyphococcus sp.]|uniref:Smr/MutS family protein n=1 Tax=Hyphococcus sp. TaxID=2038636 RepID=UPI0035C72F81